MDESVKRWYDQYPELGKNIRKLGKINPKRRNAILMEIKNIILEFNHELIDKNVMDFDMKRRWYDKEAFSWMVINSLKYADKKIIFKVLKIFEKEFPAKNG